LAVDFFSAEVAELSISCECAISIGNKQVIKIAIASPNSLFESFFWLNQNIKKFMAI